MSFFLKTVNGVWEMAFLIFPFLKEPDTGRKRIVCDIAFRGIPP